MLIILKFNRQRIHLVNEDRSRLVKPEISTQKLK